MVGDTENGEGNSGAGCPRDRDDDRVFDRDDRCPNEPGDLKDGCPSQLNADVRGIWRVNRLLSQLLSLSVNAKTGSRIELRCGRRGGCGFTKRTIKETEKRVTSLTGYFKHVKRRMLGRKGKKVVIIVRVTHPQQIGTYESLRTRTGLRLPEVTQRCLVAGTRAQIRRC